MNSRLGLLGICALLLLPAPATSQITFSNLLETRLGKDPDEPIANVPSNRLTLFDQFNFDYFQDNLRLGFRFETYKPSDNKQLEFARFTQRYAEWSDNRLEARVGNFEALFGRGVILRAFELPGVIREETFTPQFGDSRDLDGVKVQYHGSRLELVALGGNPRSPDAPPTEERRGLVSGGTATVQVMRGLRFGGEYVRLDAQSDAIEERAPRTVEVPGAFLQLSLDHWLREIGLRRLSLDSYAELAHATGLNLPAAGSSPNVDPNEGRGFYFSQNIFLEELLPHLRWGMSWEYKDYQNFELGVNEPPTLVREHTYALLNRNTHVAELVQEEGYQFESVMNLDRWSSLTLNWSRAENRNNKRYREFYAELAGTLRNTKVALFHGDSEDGIESIVDRKTYGVYGLAPLSATISIEAEYEQMTATRVLGSQDIPFKDNYLAVTLARAASVSLSLIHQTTDDPRETDDGSRRPYTSLSGSLNFGNHGIAAFWGKRRGGLQCTAGTCYQVRAFDGVLVQLLTRF